MDEDMGLGSLDKELNILTILTLYITSRKQGEPFQCLFKI